MRKISLLIISTFFFLFSNAQTFTGNSGASIGSIPDSGVVSGATCFPLTVSGLPNGGIIDSTYGIYSVTVNITHTYDADLIIRLKAPDGTTILLSNQNGSSGNDYTGTVFSSAGSNSIANGTPPFTGTFLPEGGNLGAVNNKQNGDGVWSLCIEDVHKGNTGTLNSWSITFNNTPALAPPPRPNCTSNSVAINTCVNAPYICNLDGFCGSTSAVDTVYSWPELTNTFFGCKRSTIQNNSFIRFIADSTAASFNVWAFNSRDGNGIQMLFFNDVCGSGKVINYGCTHEIPIQNAPFNIVSSGLTVGQTYYLMFDGYGGDVCDYTVQAVSGVTVVNIALEPDSSTVCRGSSIKMHGNSGSASTYSWSSYQTNPSLVNTNTALSSTSTKDVVLNTGLLPLTTVYDSVTLVGKAAVGTCPATAVSTFHIIDPPTLSQALPLTQSGLINFSPTPLSVTSTPSTGVTYQWYVNSINQNYGGTAIAGATSSTYTPPTNAAGTLYYYCTVSNGVCDPHSNTDQVIVTAGATCTPDTLAFVQQPSNTPQSSAMSPAVTVKVFCKANGINYTPNNYAGLVTLTAKDGCGYISQSVNAVNGLATFSNVVFTRSIQNGVSLVATAVGITGSALSDTFSITAPTGGGGTTTKDTTVNIIDYNFNTPSSKWSYTLSVPSGSSTDVTGVVTLNGKTYLSKSSQNETGDPETTNTITFNNIDLTKYSNKTNPVLTFELASLNEIGTLATNIGTGAGVDSKENLFVETSTDGGVTWLPLLEDDGTNNKLFDFNSTPINLTINGGQVYTGTDKTSGLFTVTIPSGTSQFQFRVTATDNRTSENWCIGNILLKADSTITISSTPAKQSPLPTLTVSGDTSICSPTSNPGSAAKLYSIATDTVGTASYAWTPSNGFSPISDSTKANPSVSPTTNQQYNLTIVDADKCKATAGPVSVIVNKSPVLNSQLTPAQTVCVGGTFNALSVTASNTETYQWYSNTKALNTGGTLINGATTPSYTPPSAVAGTTYYYCELAGVCSPKVTSAVSGAITVNAIPTLTDTSLALSCSVASVDLSKAIVQSSITPSPSTWTYTYSYLDNTKTLLPKSVVSAPGTYYVAYQYSPQGCADTTAITVTQNGTTGNTITLSSASGTDAQKICINTAITNITYATTGATGATFTGLPNGVTGNFNSITNVVTISGAPTSSGAFSYTVTMTGGCPLSATGTITVTPDNTVGAPSTTPTLCINTALTPITFTTTGATGIGAATGLPAGVTASWAANTITITGTPTASGIFNYNIPLTGGCGNVAATGTITVTPDNTVGAPSSTPTLCINTVLTAITFTTTGATGIGAATGLPAGVTASWAANTITITGTPTASGTFNYSIPLTGGCGNVAATGTITVTPANTVGLPSSTPTLCINTVLTTITFTTTGATGIGAAIGLPAGVTASWAANTITITGIPTASGTFNYSIPLNGGCGNVAATGIITVTPDNTVGTPSSTPTLCINTALTAITFTTTGATGIGAATGLPAGVTASWAANTITITGTPTASGIFNYNIPLTGGCGNVAATGTITVTALPTDLFLTGSAICSNSTGGTITSSTSQIGVGYQLFNNSNAIIGTPVIGTGSGLTWSNIASGIGYYVIAANSNACTSKSNSVDVSINPIPTITVQPVNPGCSTIGVDLDSAITSDKTGLSFSFYSDAGLTTAVANPVLAAGTYYVKATNAAGCSNSTSVTVGSFRNYPVFITKPMKPICGQTAVNLDTSITTSITGLTIKYYTDSLLTNPLATPVVTKDTTYYLTATNSDGCTTATSVVVSPFKPTPILATTTVASGCGVSSVDLDSSITSSKVGLTFDFYSDAALTNVVTNPVLAPGTYFIKATNSDGCTSSAPVTVQAFKPYPLITTSPVSPACGVATIDLGKAITSNVAGLTIKYFSDSLLTKSATNPVDSAGTYFIEATNANGCSSSTSIVVSSLKPNPTLTTAPINPVCGVTSVDLGTGITSSTSSLVINYYQDAGLTVMATNPVSAAGNYYVSAVNANGCTSSASIVVGVFKPGPVLTTTAITPACGASTIDLSTGITSSIAGLTVKYYSDPALTSPVSNPVTAVGTYYVEVTSANGCSSSSSIVVNAFNTNPVITTHTIIPVCGATSVDLATGITTSTTGLILTYYQDAAHTVVETNPVTAAGTYYVSGANANGCTGSASIVVDAFKPNPIITTKGITPGCGATSVDLGAAIISDTVGLSISYYSDIALANAVINPVSISDTTYYIKVTNANGCWASSPVAVDSFKAAIPLATQTISPKCGQVSVDLGTGITSPTSGLTITYYDNAALTIVETNPVSAAGTYYIKATSNATGCYTSSSIVVNAFLLTPVVITKDISLACGITTADLGTGVISDTTGLSVSYYSDTSAPAKLATNPVTAAGKYYVKVVNASGCSATEKIIVDSFKLNPVITTTALTPACGVTSANLDSAITSPTAGLSLTFYQDSALTVQETNPVFAAGKYYVKAISTKGCSSSDSIIVKAFRLNPTIVTHEITSACGVDSADLSTGILSSTTGLQVAYYGDAAHKDTVLNPIIRTAGTYYISVTNAVGCSASASVLVDAFKFTPIAKAIVGDTTLCINLTTQLTDSITPGKWYSLQPSIAGIDTTSGLVTGKKFGDATIRYIVSNVCGADSVYHTVKIVGKRPQILPVPENPTCLYPTSGKILFDITGSEGPYLLKYGSNYYSDSIDNLPPGLYDVTIYNKFGCDVADYTNIPLSLANDVSCDTLYVPTGFAPGLAATGKNYSLKPFGGSQSNISNLSFKVYNRYGNIVFESHDLYLGWDGNYNGAPQGTGTFVWYLEYKINGRFVTQKGTSVLIR